MESVQSVFPLLLFCSFKIIQIQIIRKCMSNIKVCWLSWFSAILLLPHCLLTTVLEFWTVYHVVTGSSLTLFKLIFWRSMSWNYCRSYSLYKLEKRTIIAYKWCRIILVLDIILWHNFVINIYKPGVSSYRSMWNCFS